jgi:hypothetical protein
VTWTGVACSVEPLDEIVPSHEAKAGR